MTHRLPPNRAEATWLLLALLLIPAGMLVQAPRELDTFASRSGWQVSAPATVARPAQLNAGGCIDDVVEELRDRVSLPAATVLDLSLLATRYAALTSVPPENFDRTIRFLHLTI